MTLVNATSIVQPAFEQGYAVPSINTNGACDEILRAVCEVASEQRAPMILGCYEANAGYRGLDYCANAMRWHAERCDAPIAVHLDHGMSVDGCRQGLDAGFTSVMFDGSKTPLQENLANTKRIVELAAPHGVSVEAEIGELQQLNPDGSMGEVKNLSDADEVQAMADTGIDMLAVGIGNAHGFYKGQPNIRFDLLEQFAQVSRVPLVLHGTTGLADETINRCVSMGMAKVNLGTLIRHRHVEYTADAINTTEHNGHPWRVQQAVKDRLKDHIRHIVDITRSAGRAGELAA